MNENHDLISNKNEKCVGKIKIETPENIWIADFLALRSQAYSFKCCDKNTKKIEGTSNSHSKNNKFEEFYKSVFGGEHRKRCDIVLFHSIIHEKYLQNV